MWEDEIVEEIRKLREEYAASFGFDLEAIYQDLKEREKQRRRMIVFLEPKEPASVPQAKAS